MASSHFARLDKHLAWCYSTAMMLPPTHPQDLFDCLRSALQNGGQLTDGLLDYVETALFLPRPDRLAAFLRNDDDSERDSLLDLIFYPEPDFQVLLEPLLMATPLTADDAAALRGRLLDEDIQAPVRMPDGTPLAHIPLPAFVKSHYLDRLNLAWQPDASLAAAITSGVAPARVPVVRVRLRNQGARPVAGQQVFLCRFFERLPDDDPDFWHASISCCRWWPKRRRVQTLTNCWCTINGGCFAICNKLAGSRPCCANPTWRRSCCKVFGRRMPTATNGWNRCA